MKLIVYSLFFISMMSSANVFTQSIQNAPIKDYRTSKAIHIKDLNFVALLEKIRGSVLEISSQSGPSEALMAQVIFIEDIINLIKSIIESFRLKATSDNPRLIYKFVTLMRLPQDIDHVCPRDIRLMRKKATKYSSYVKDYFIKHRKSLSHKEIDFLNNIIRLNDQLLDGVLQENFLGVSPMANLTDAFFHRPLEFAKKHKVFVGTTISIATFAAFMYFYGWPWLQEKQYGDLYQLKVLDQRGNQCPFHALFNVWCMMNEKDVKFMQSRKEYEKKYQEWRFIIGKKDNLDTEEIMLLIGLADCIDNTDNLTVMRSMNSYTQAKFFKKIHEIDRLKRLAGDNCLGFFEVGRNEGKSFKEVMESDRWKALRNQAQENGIDISFMENEKVAYDIIDNANFIESFNAEAEQIGTYAHFKSNGTFYEKLSRLKHEGESQYILANLASRSRYREGSDPIGHWVALKLDQGDKGDTLKITAANSLGNSDIRGHKIMDHLQKLYKQVE